MQHHNGDLADTQQEHWQRTYGAHPGMYGQEPSTPAVHATEVFHANGAKNVLELGAGYGRDALYFAHEGFTVQATDFSATGLEQLKGAAQSQGLATRVTTAVHDVREPLPLPDASVDAIYAHMLLCMALSTQEIHALVRDVRRVLRRGGVFIRLPFLAVAVLFRILRAIRSLCASRRQVTCVKARGPLRHRSARRPVPDDDRDPGGHLGLLVFLPVTTPGNPSRAGSALISLCSPVSGRDVAACGTSPASARRSRPSCSSTSRPIRRTSTLCSTSLGK
jgi:SAM-dependent methyltransferase